MAKKRKKKELKVEGHMEMILEGEEMSLPVGWLCPLCRKVMSPFVSVCPGVHAHIIQGTMSVADEAPR